ncbi:MAG: hypothetical protein EPO51_15480 [Phenylobacterium sp.]|uniref:hypothetical protein n=1 Tax=Phenylobacterium sp. TaxID=1871053 RepID=UPI00120E1F77|nr:hypothetical protein [Phenylobacterium sp.]TAJ70914.1 MAG: hypothetical protein EPO51_15480 [Phenylobacterium sp.]
MATSHAIDWVLLDHTADRPVDIGDVVSVDAGGMPIYRVLGLEGRAVRVDDERHRDAQVIPLDRFRWRGGTH